jgi:hypothetical protein
MIFCDRIRHDLMDYNSKSFTITGGDLTAHKETLGWIKECIAEQSIVKYKDVSFASARQPSIEKNPPMANHSRSLTTASLTSSNRTPMSSSQRHTWAYRHATLATACSSACKLLPAKCS